MDTTQMEWAGTDGRELWIQWHMLLDRTLLFKSSKRYEKMSDKQKKAYCETMHNKLKAINAAAHKADVDYINRIKNKYGIQ